MDSLASESAILEVKLEHPEEQETASEPPPATFTGRLNLSSFAFSPNTPRRNSPRLNTHPPQSPSPLTPKSAQAAKRKYPSTLASPSPAKKKKARSSTGYAPPSKYSHLPELQDVLAPNLHCIFIGLNPGLTTASTGHAYAHPSNHFWKLLHSSGLTPRRLSPTEDGTLPRDWGMGNTNIVSRPTRNGSELLKSEMDAAVSVLASKIRRYNPGAVCVVGKSIWESIFRVQNGRGLRKGEFAYGWQEGVRMGRGGEGDAERRNWEGAKVFVATSTSGLAASVAPAEKERIWRVLGDWVNERRRLRAEGEGEEGVEEVKIEETEEVEVMVEQGE